MLRFQAQSLSSLSAHLLLFIHLILQGSEVSWVLVRDKDRERWIGKGETNVSATWVDHGSWVNQARTRVRTAKRLNSFNYEDMMKESNALIQCIDISQSHRPRGYVVFIMLIHKSKGSGEKKKIGIFKFNVFFCLHCTLREQKISQSCVHCHLRIYLFCHHA